MLETLTPPTNAQPASPLKFWEAWAHSAMVQPWLRWQSQCWKDSAAAKLFPLDPTQVCRAMVDLSETLISQPALMEKQLGMLTVDQMRLGLWTLRRLAGDCAQDPIETPTRDRRFEDRDWVDLLPFSLLRQSYLLWSRWLADTAAQLGGDADTRARIGFYLRQWSDAVSPTNLPATNPVVLRETIESGGENLQRGLSNFLADAERGSISLVPRDSYRPGDNLALTPGQVVYRNELMELIQYSPATRTTYAVPLLILPPWINRYYVLDMRPGMSLIEHLVAQGHSVFVVSWRNPGPSQAQINLEDYLKLGAVDAIKVVKAITRSRAINLAGYCIGGTLLGITLAYLAAKRSRSVNSATFFTSLLDFSDVGETRLFVSEDQLADVRARMEAKGFLSPEELSTVFRLMRGNDLIWNFAVNNYLLGRKPPAFDLMHWSVDGTRLPRAMQEYYLYNMYLQNNLSKPGMLELLGTPIDLGRVSCPSYFVAGAEDHIVPWKTAFRSAQLLAGPHRFVLGKAGHITAVICPSGSRRARYHVGIADAQTDADTWLTTQAAACEGSWWPDWVKWLSRISGRKATPPPLGSRKYPPLEPAPGRYVLES